MNSPALPVVVVGSGPAGIAAAQGLLRAGVAVTLLDVGAELPPEAQDWRDSLAAQSPGDWDQALVARHNRSSLREREGVPLKTVYGSDYAYRQREELSSDGVTLVGSNALGGLSNVWGGSILPLCERDMQGWPLQRADLDPHYAAVLDWLPHAQSADDLSADYPLHSNRATPLDLAPQSQALLDDLEAGRETLRSARVRFGRARVTVQDCRYCGQCLHGCPYDVIYSSRQTLATLQANPNFSYLGNREVLGITEHDASVELHIDQGGVRDTLTAERVYLGTGVLNTALLALPLLGQKQLQIRDSAYYVLPYVRRARLAGTAGHPTYTLAQLFMEVDLPELSTRNVHLQWYGYNDFYAQELAAKLGPLYPLVPTGIANLLLERLWTVQGFLHSDDSPAIELTLDDSNQRATLRALENPRADELFAATIDRLKSLGGVLRGWPLGIAMRRGPVGSSFHSGASLPMANNPVGLQSDTAGRPAGLQRVHIVDASVLPNIASSTITLSIMANAHRIASAHRDYS